MSELPLPPVDLSGPRFDRIRKRVVDWYWNERQRMITALEREYPYGSRKLEPTEQLERFISMSSEDYQKLIARLNHRHRGQENAVDLVNADLAQYMAAMIGLMLSSGELSAEEIDRGIADIQSSLGVEI